MPNIQPGITREVHQYRFVNHRDHKRNDFVVYPRTWPPFFNGGGSVPCDMLAGPCACGASHSLDEWIPARYEDEVIAACTLSMVAAVDAARKAT